MKSETAPRDWPLAKSVEGMERKTGFEPAAFSLARRCSTTELLPHLH